VPRLPPHNPPIPSLRSTLPSLSMIASITQPPNFENMPAIATPLTNPDTGGMNPPWDNFFTWLASRAAYMTQLNSQVQGLFTQGGIQGGQITDIQTAIAALEEQIITLQGQVATLQGQVVSLQNSLSHPIFQGGFPNPAGTTNLSYVQMGFGLRITPPTSGNMLVTAEGSIGNSNNGGETDVTMSWGTGGSPANGVPIVGNAVHKSADIIVSTGGDYSPFALTTVLQGLNPANSIWIDLAAQVTTGLSILRNVNFIVTGLA
jgi:hypothetical protein